MSNDDTPAPCGECSDVPHDTVCDRCSRLLCNDCSRQEPGGPLLCPSCNDDDVEHRDSMDAASYDEATAVDPALAAALDEYVTRSPPECPMCEGSGMVRAQPSYFAVEHVNDTCARCPACNPPRDDCEWCDPGTEATHSHGPYLLCAEHHREACRLNGDLVGRLHVHGHSGATTQVFVMSCSTVHCPTSTVRTLPPPSVNCTS